MSKWHTKLFGILSLALILALLTIPAQAAKFDTSRISIASDGTQANNHSYRIRISPDGGYAVFWSLATNLVSNDTNGKADVFMRNVQANTTALISFAWDGAQGNDDSLNPSVSSNGRYVAFESKASNLVTGDNNGVSDIFVRDTVENSTVRVSVATDGSEGNLASSYPVISPDGRYVLFESSATNLVANDTNAKIDVFMRDLQTNTTTRLSVDSAGVQGNNDSSAASISADGRYVAFASLASNLVSGDTNGARDIFVRDTQGNTTTCVSVNPTGKPGTGQSRNPVISSNGRYVAFDSFASDLVSGDTNGAGDVFVRDTQSGTTTRVSLTWDGSQATVLSSYPSISSDGRYVTFMSQAILINGDKNGKYDIFVRDMLSATTTRVSIASDGTQGNDASTYPVISDDGQFVAFLSDATNLVSGDTNGVQDVFLHHRGGVYITASDKNPTNASSLSFIVAFSDDVTGVDVGDFSLNQTGTLAGATVTGVSGSDAVYTVTASTGTGSGLLRLDIPASATILDPYGYPILGLPYTRGEMYVIDRIPPTVSSIMRTDASPANTATVKYTVTFSEAVINVDASDFALTTTGTLSGTSVSLVEGDGLTRTVTVNTGTGIGTLRLDIPVTATIADQVGNPLSDAPYTGGQEYVVRIQSFADVPTNHWAWQWIERLYASGLTGGCGTNPLIYCPENSVTRAEMAVFLEKGMRGKTYLPPNDVPITFGDTADHWAKYWIEALAADGITAGCGGGNYCPENATTREQMAIFLLRAKHVSGYTPPPVGDSTGFSDVPVGSPYAAWIKQLAAEGVTAGCGGGNYCPGNPVKRSEMAVFLVRTFNLP